MALDCHGLALSKLERNVDRDREDVLWLAQSSEFDLAVLQSRYEDEVRPFVKGPVSRHDQTLALWMEMITEHRETNR